MENLKEKARNLRKNQTDVEALMWGQLRNRRFLGLKFKRQYPIPPYITDFTYFEKKLIIELDGSQHAKQKNYDKKRTKHLEKEGFTVIRIWNNEVTENLEGVMEYLRKIVK